MNSKYQRIEFTVGSTIEDSVNQLLKYKSDGLVVYGEFSGCILYSDTVTLDDAYKEITGMTYSEFNQKRQKFIDEM